MYGLNAGNTSIFLDTKIYFQPGSRLYSEINLSLDHALAAPARENLTNINIGHSPI